MGPIRTLSTQGGRSISIVTQYDIDLVHAIESEIGKELSEHADTDEEDVLKLLNRVRGLCIVCTLFCVLCSLHRFGPQW